jgi:hypothetical protein
METLTQEILGEIFSYMDKYEITDLLIAIPEWDSELNWMERVVIQNQEEYHSNKKDCNCERVISPLMGQMIKIIESSRYELLEFYSRIFDHNRFHEYIFSWVLLFGEESFVEYYWNQKKKHSDYLFRFYENSTHLVYGLEMISFKMRNRLPIHDIYSVWNMIRLYSFQNKDIDFLYKNYHRVERKRPLPMRLFQEINDKYRSWILKNPSFFFVYIEKQDRLEEFEEES